MVDATGKVGLDAAQALRAFADPDKGEIDGRGERQREEHGPSVSPRAGPALVRAAGLVARRRGAPPRAPLERPGLRRARQAPRARFNAPTFALDNHQRPRVEPKDETRKRLRPARSPDGADAVTLSVFDPGSSFAGDEELAEPAEFSPYEGGINPYAGGISPHGGLVSLRAHPRRGGSGGLTAFASGDVSAPPPPAPAAAAPGGIRPRMRTKLRPRITPLPINQTRWLQRDVETSAADGPERGPHGWWGQLYRAFCATA